MTRIELLKGVKVISQIYESVISSYNPIKGDDLDHLISYEIDNILLYGYQFEELKNALSFEELDNSLNDMSEFEGFPITARDMITWALRKVIRELILSDLDEGEEA